MSNDMCRMQRNLKVLSVKDEIENFSKKNMERD